MEITEGIQQLLYQYDVVIVPGLGRFKCSYRPASIHPTQHLFDPPHKAIIFEKKDEDDGLLAHYLSEMDDLPPGTIANKIFTFVNDLKQNLEKAGEATINGIGTFKYDIEKQLHFIQDGTVNFLTSSYGLDQFISPPILRRSEQPQKSLAQKRQKVIAIAKENSIVLWLLLAFIFALVAAIYFIFRSGIIVWWHS